MRTRFRRPSPALVIAVLALVVAATGVGVAAIPSPDGTISACYFVKGGMLRVVDVQQGQKCLKGEKPLTWSQEGPAGPAGAAGPKGDPGPAGDSGALQAIREQSLVDPPGDPSITAIERTVSLRAAGLWDVRMDTATATACPAGPDACSFAVGLYVDGNPVPNTAYNPSAPANSSFGCESGFGRAGAGGLVPVSAGSHTFAVKIEQVGGGPATVTPCPTQKSVSITGPYAP